MGLCGPQNNYLELLTASRRGHDKRGDHRSAAILHHKCSRLVQTICHVVFKTIWRNVWYAWHYCKPFKDRFHMGNYANLLQVYLLNLN